ncbi:RlmE family RNA methyltransferase [Myxococcota bacterium]|nr:RlmE family RNA methyltransferase [Myxococcota bacterium]MBU1433116.1 RlmE family RNA methyltransferase [Myxococcota bacterium]MBU1900047.1 RlmE family RNA methyltransferase [Myxococcota bacterium]
MRREMDTFAKRAQREGFRARSIYKLEEIDQRTSLLKPGQAVLDLGCAPGSWLQYAARRVGKKGKVLGVDLQEVAPLPEPQITLLQADAFALDEAALIALGGPFDVVLSDMAPATSGNRFTDHVRSVALCRRAFEVAARGLKPGGAFVCKVFEGAEVNDLAQEIKPHFKKLKRIKPKATRKESVELFIVAQGFIELEKTEEK